jgi:hypothetical protein
MVGRSLPWLDMMTRTPLSPTSELLTFSGWQSCACIVCGVTRHGPIDRKLPRAVQEHFVKEHARCEPAPRAKLETLDG